LPLGVAASPEGRRVYVADSSGRGAISVIDTATSAVAAVVEMGDGLTVPWLEGARRVAVSPDGRRVYATSPARYSVVVIDATTNQVVDTIKITTGKYLFPTDLAVSPDGKRVYVTDFNGHSVSAIDTAANQVTATLPMSDFPWGVAVSPNSARLYVIHKPTWTVDVVDAGTLQVVGTVKLGPIPTGTN
jgi:YVTN family beta-propeller protein